MIMHDGGTELCWAPTACDGGLTGRGDGGDSGGGGNGVIGLTGATKEGQGGDETIAGRTST